MGASVRARLLAYSKESDQQFQLVLTRYALERLLYRLSQSAHADRFILKGAMLLTSWFDLPMRPTRDIDLLGFGDDDSEAMLKTFREILAVEADDGIQFDRDALMVERIRDHLAYGGIRLRTKASIDGALVAVVIDIGFGDATEPGAEKIVYPVMLDQPAPRLRAYAKETVIAEKFQAMVNLGRANTRMKDFFDIWLMAQSFSFEDDRLARAIAATFARRKTAIPHEPPDALTQGFANDREKIDQWTAFIRDISLDAGLLSDVIASLAAFLMPQAAAARRL
jgi:predicted nucleotidyltransferase component of viral defense system